MLGRFIRIENDIFQKSIIAQKVQNYFGKKFKILNFLAKKFKILNFLAKKV